MVHMRYVTRRKCFFFTLVTALAITIYEGFIGHYGAIFHEMKNTTLESCSESKQWFMQHIHRPCGHQNFSTPKPTPRLKKPSQEAGDICATKLALHQTEVNKKCRRSSSFLIAGVSKCGTGTLSYFLNFHPSLVGPMPTERSDPEINFFNIHFSKGQGWYVSRLPPSEPWQLTFEKSLLFPHPEKAKTYMKRMDEFNRSLKLVIIVRNPLKRIKSSFTQLFGAKLKNLPNGSYEMFANHFVHKNGTVNLENSILIKDSDYLGGFLAWKPFFDRGKLHFLDGDAFAKDPVSELQRLEDILGIPHFFTSEHFVFDRAKGFFCYQDKYKMTKHCVSKTKGVKYHFPLPSNVDGILRNYLKPRAEQFLKEARLNFRWDM